MSEEEGEKKKRSKIANKERRPDGGDFLVVHGAGAVTRISSNLILVKTTSNEEITCMNKKGGERKIEIAKTKGLVLGPRAGVSEDTNSNTESALLANRGSPVTTEEGAKVRADKIEHVGIEARPTSPSDHVSLPPENPVFEVEGVPSNLKGAIGDGVDNESQEDIIQLTETIYGLADGNYEESTSLTSSMKDIIPKLLNIDNKNKIKITHLEELLSKAQSKNERLLVEISQKNAGEISTNSENVETKPEKGMSRKENEHRKTKRQLKKALEANEAWNRYSQDQHLVHLRQIKLKEEEINTLENQIQNQMEASKQENSKRLEDEMKMLCEKQQHMEAEHRKIMKLAKGLHKEKGDLQNEIQNLRSEIDVLKKDRISKKSEETGRKAAENKSTIPTELDLPEVHKRKLGTKSSRTFESRTAPMPVLKDKKSHDVPKANASRQLEKPMTEIREQKPKGNLEAENMFFLQTQIKQYEEDFHRERRDRERVFGEMRDIKKELENTKLRLHEKERLTDKKKGKFVNPLKLPTKLKKDNRRRESSDPGLRVTTLEDTTDQSESCAREGNRYVYQEEGGANGNHVYHEIPE